MTKGGEWKVDFYFNSFLLLLHMHVYIWYYNMSKSGELRVSLVKKVCKVWRVGELKVLLMTQMTHEVTHFPKVKAFKARESRAEFCETAKLQQTSHQVPFLSLRNYLFPLLFFISTFTSLFQNSHYFCISLFLTLNRDWQLHNS